MRRPALTAVLSAALALSFGCSLSSDDVRTRCGVPPSRAARDSYVTARAIAPAPALPSDRDATLGDLLRLVDEGSVEVQQARAELAAASAAVKEARSALLP